MTMSEANQATTSECHEDAATPARCVTLLSITHSESGPILTFYEESEETASDGARKRTKHQIPESTVQRSKLLVSVTDAAQIEPSEVMVPFPSCGLVAWMQVCSQPSEFILPLAAVHCLEVAIYLGDEDAARIAAKHVAELTYTFVKEKADSSTVEPRKREWQNPHPYVQHLCDLSPDALALVASRFHYFDVVGAPDVLSHAWVECQLQHNSNTLTLKRPVSEVVNTKGCESADEYMEVIRTFWNAPATGSRCSDLCIPAFSCIASEMADAMKKRLLACALGERETRPTDGEMIQLSKPVASTLHPLSTVTALTLGSRNSKYSVPTEASIVYQMLELLPNLKSLTMRASIVTEGSMRRDKEQRRARTLGNNTQLCTDEEVLRLAAQIFKLPLRELSLLGAWILTEHCTALCPHLQHATALTKLQLPCIYSPERASYAQALPCLVFLQELKLDWQMSESVRDGLSSCLKCLQPLTALHTIDLKFRVQRGGGRTDVSQELGVLAQHLSLSHYPHLKHLGYESPVEDHYGHSGTIPEHIIQWLKSLQSLSSLNIHCPFDAPLNCNSVYEIKEHYKLSRRFIHSSLLLRLLPKLGAVQVVSHFQARLRDYILKRMEYNFIDLQSALVTHLTGLQSLRVLAEEDDVQPDFRDSCGVRDSGEFFSFLGVMSACMPVLSALREVFITCDVRVRSSRGQMTAVFIAQMITMTQLECLVMDVTGMNGEVGCSVETCAIETAAATCPVLEHPQLTRLYFECMDSSQAASPCSDAAASFLQQFTKLTDLSICFGFSLEQFSFLNSLSVLEHLRFPVAGQATKEEWGPLCTTLGELACLRSLRVDAYDEFHFGIQGEKEVCEAVTNLRHLSSLKLNSHLECKL